MADENEKQSPFQSSGWTIYPKALKGIVKKYTGSFKDMTGFTVTEIKWQIRKKSLLLCSWGTLMDGISTA